MSNLVENFKVEKLTPLQKLIVYHLYSLTPKQCLYITPLILSKHLDIAYNNFMPNLLILENKKLIELIKFGNAYQVLPCENIYINFN